MSKRLDPLDAMWQQMNATLPPPLPMHDEKVHGFTISQIGERRGMCTTSARELCRKMEKSGLWIATEVMLRTDGKATRTVAYRPKGGARE